MSITGEKTMIPIDEAVGIVLSEAYTLPTMTVSVRGCRGYVLAEDVHADADVPAFNRSMMDGYALRASDSGEGKVIPVDGIVAAGQFRSEPVPEGHAVKIMTGAPVPDDCDAVIEVELTEESGSGSVRLNATVEPGMNIANKGEEIGEGDEMLRSGTLIDPVVAAVLAMAGKYKVRITQPPRVGILTTGTELVEPGHAVGPGQIRESNSYGLMAQCLIWGAIPMKLGQSGDEPEKLRVAIENGLKYNILAITGGVSMGDFDLVPDILRELGVEILFHKVAQKPAKPILFGKRDGTIVFGLPGNPVACFLGFELYTGPMIRRMAGETNFETKWYKGITSDEFKAKSDRAQLKIARAEWTDNSWLVHPARSMGSADINSVVGTNVFARFEKGHYTVPKGENVEFFFHRGKPNGT